jgi:hypothetical protein
MFVSPASIRKGVGILSAIVASGFVTYQYFDSKWKARIERSLQYILIYQDQNKVAARNEIDLWPPRQQKQYSNPDIAELLANVKPEITYPDCIEKYSAVSTGLDHPELIAQRQNMVATLCAVEFANRLQSGLGAQPPDNSEDTTTLELPPVDECREQIYAHAQAKIIEQVGKEAWSDGISTLDGVSTKWGSVTRSGDRLWWSDNGSYYYYAWPDLVWEFFQSPEKSQGCSTLVEAYEAALDDRSENILERLHELKHFYAAMSICTTSGLCDALVACEAFNADVANFVANWQQYFELWSARRTEAEYYRLQGFVSHCFSNQRFVEYSQSGEGSPMLYIQGFASFW